MSEPVWLNRETVELIHQQSIELTGGAHGLRDTNLLESALARPLSLKERIFEKTFKAA